MGTSTLIFISISIYYITSLAILIIHYNEKLKLLRWDRDFWRNIAMKIDKDHVDQIHKLVKEINEFEKNQK